MRVLLNLDKFGTFGLFLIAILSPCCFPLFAFAATAFGLGSFELFGGFTFWVFQAMVLVTLWGLYLSMQKHSCWYPLIIAIPSALLIFYGYHLNSTDYWIYFIYLGMMGVLIATVWNYRRNKMHSTCDNCNSD